MNKTITNPLLAVSEFIKITTLLSSQRSLNRLLDTVVRSARTIANADAGIIAMLDSTKRNLYIEVFQSESLGFRQSDYPVIPLFANGKRNIQNVNAYSAFNGEIVNIEDVYKYSGFDFRDFYELDNKTGYRTTSLLTLPLVNHQQVTVGVLQLVNAMDANGKNVIPFSLPVKEVVAAFASQAAVAIDNVQLIRDNTRLIQVLNQTNRTLESENQRLKRKIDREYDFSKIIGEGPAINKVFSLIEKIVHSDATVLIQGETGTGKEIVAHAIHYNSHRRAKEFIAQNCAALPENLLESELFGYSKGAFSGANTDKKGLIEQAHGGTLFLDEIGDIPIGLQAKLLRVLQDKEVRPLGSVKTIKVNVRIVAATHCDLVKKVSEGEFRQDLYYRLSVFPIELPPLRERKEDLPALISHFVESFSKKYDKCIKGVSPVALERLIRYTYPGNVRELKNILERAILLCEAGGTILPQYLPDELAERREPLANLSILTTRFGSLKEMVEAYEASIITEKLEACNWNQTRTAAELQVARRTLIEKMNRYRIVKFTRQAEGKAIKV